MSRRIDGTEREALRQRVLAEGFSRVGFTGAEDVADHAGPWVAAGRHAGMEWMERDPSARARPTALLPEARSVIVVGAAYPASTPGDLLAGYACGEDYHRTLRAALERVAAGLREHHGDVRTRICVDTAPLLERALAARAGLGWIGRSTLLLDETHGPWMLLGELLTDLEIAPDAPVAERCGTCTACVDVCPTDALDGAGGLDARRCLSYWTIEHRGPLPGEVAGALHGHAFGCDDCLTACPFPAGGASTDAHAGAFEPRPDLVGIDAAALRARSAESFKRHFGSTPLERARKGGLLRNLAALDGPPPPPAV